MLVELQELSISYCILYFVFVLVHRLASIALVDL